MILINLHDYIRRGSDGRFYLRVTYKGIKYAMRTSERAKQENSKTIRFRTIKLREDISLITNVEYDELWLQNWVTAHPTSLWSKGA